MKYRVSSRHARPTGAHAPLPRIEPLEGRRLLSAALSAQQQDDAGAHVAFLEAAAESERPSIRSTTPEAGATGVAPTAYVVAYVNLPNVGGVTDDQTVLAANVRLFRAGDPARTPIPSKVNTTGGGDAIILTPLEPLANNTEYQYEVSEGLTDTSEAPFQPFTMRFTTGDDDQLGPDPNVVFQKVSQPTA